MVFITGQLQTYTGDFYRMVSLPASSAARSRCWLARAHHHVVARLRLPVDSSPPVVPVIGIFRHQLFNLLIIAFRQFSSACSVCLRARRRLRPTNHHGCARLCGRSAAVATQWQTAYHRQNQNNREARDASFNIVVSVWIST